MKINSILIFLILFNSCSDRNKTKGNKNQKELNQNIQKIEFDLILDSANVNGSILIFDSQKNKYYSNDFKWCKVGKLPASTFKITNSIIALETGIVEDTNTMFKWNGEKRALKKWEQDLNFKDAFRFSCVPCYQEVARKIGLDRMKEYIAKLEYGEIEFNLNSIDNFWLVGKSKINQFQQIDFLQRLYQSELPIEERTEKIMKELMVIEINENYKLYGKTGWSVKDKVNNGWFIGYIETDGKVYYFATNVDPKDNLDMTLFPMIREEVTYNAFKEMKLIK